MIAGILACIAVRFYVSATEPAHLWKVDAPVTAIALLVTASIIMNRHPEPFVAVMYGTGIGAMGVLIIKLALSYVQRVFGAFDPAATDQRPPTA